MPCGASGPGCAWQQKRPFLSGSRGDGRLAHAATAKKGGRQMRSKDFGWLFLAVGALLLCNGDLRCAVRKTLGI